jgi:hypothetical protein
MLRLIPFAICAGLVTQSALGQGPPPNAPTTVQLPTFSFFTVQTTVSVPDRGGALLGGLGRAADGSTSRGLGPLANRASGSSRGANGMSVNATIIDRDEMDQAVLAQAANSKAVSADAKAGQISSSVGRLESTSQASSAGSLAEIRGQQAADLSKRAAEAKELFTKAQRAEAEGKPGLARIYYQMVLRRDPGPLRQSAPSRLAALSDGTSSTIAAR